MRQIWTIGPIYEDFNYWLLDLNLLWNSIINDETDAMAN